MFKTIAIAAATAATLIATPVLAAPFDGHHDRGRSEQQNRRDDHRGYDQRDNRFDRGGYHRWNKGQRFDSRYARNYRVINNYRSYRLHEAPRGYRWVQSGNDAVLIGITSGIVASVLAGAIN